jgi:hypothetical protein
MSQLECGGVWVECVEHTPQLHMIDGGEAYMEDKGPMPFIEGNTNIYVGVGTHIQRDA